MKKQLHPFWFILLLILLVSLACTTPMVSPETEDTEATNRAETVAEDDLEAAEDLPSPTPTIPPLPTPTPQPLPPTLVEAEPMPGSVLALDGGLTFFFNQPMDRGSVEGALTGQPQLSGQLTWSDDTTLVYEPDAPISPDTHLVIELGTEAQAANGLAMLEPVRLAYYTAAPMQAVQVLPKPDTVEVDPTSAVVATFDQPVVALGADPATLPNAFEISPAVAGRGEWVNTSTYIYYPDPPLHGGQSYTVSLNPELRGTTGTSLDGRADSPGTMDWTFSTLLPRLVSVSPEPDDAQVAIDAVVNMVFNQPMQAESVAENFAMLAPGGESVTGDMGWNEDYTTMTFTPTQMLNRSADYSILLLGLAQSQGGTAIAADYSQRITTVPQLYITSTDPAQDGQTQNYRGVTINFSAPIDPDDPMQYISIAPPVGNLSSWTGQRYQSLHMVGDFKPLTEYLVTVSSALPDRWGQTLGQEYSLRFTTEGLRPTLAVAHGEPELFITPQENTLSLQAASLRSLDLALSVIPPDQLWQFIGPGSYDTIRQYASEYAQYWSYPLDASQSHLSTFQVPISPDGSALPPGIYHFRISSTDLDHSVGPYLVISSNIQMVLKISPTQVFVWALDLQTGRAAANAPVEVYDGDGNLVASGTTDAEGVFQSAIPVKPDVYGTYYAVLGKVGDPGFSVAYSSWNSGIQGYDFNIITNYTGPSVRAYLYTDRPVYRPGQTVFFRAIVRQARNGRYALPDIGILPVSVMDGSFESVVEMELPLSEYGSAHGEFVLPEGAQPGYYSLSTPHDSISFQVAEYRKPEIELEISAQPDPATIGDVVQAEINARYYFDAPAGNIPLHWQVSRSPEFFSLPGYKTGVEDYAWMAAPWQSMYNPFGELVESGEGITGGEGRLTVKFPTDHGKTTARYTLEVTLKDESGFSTSHSHDVIVHPADFYIGVRPASWVGQAGSEISFEIKTVDWARQPAGAHTLRAAFRKVQWVRGEKTDPYGYPSYEPVYSSVSSADFHTGDDGLARLAFTPPEAGTYELEISGEGAVTRLVIWVGGTGQVAWPNTPNQHIHLTADQTAYEPGETAEILIPNPLGGSVQALVTIERGEVMRHQVIQIDGNTHALSLPLTGADAPNVFVAVTLVGAGTGDNADSQGAFDFRQGYLNLEVAPVEQILNVSLTPVPERAGPQEEVSFTVRVTDAAGTPVQGEFSLAVVDKALLALVDPFAQGIEEAFYGVQPLGVRTGVSLAAYAHRFTINPGGLGGGGGDIDVSTVREDFPDTALWRGDIVTDNNGEALIAFVLPDNLTTWVASSRGVTVDSRVGETETVIVSTKDLLVRPVTPRFMVVGDHLKLSGIVHNNTNTDLTADVRLQATGFVLDDPVAATHQVAIPAGGRVVVEWWGTVEDVEAVDLIFSADSGEYSDATRPVWGDLPVLRYTALQTFGTAGTLREGEERLEIVSLPRTFDPEGGGLEVELAPSLAAAMIPALDVLEHYPYECTEQILSRFLPNLEAYQAVQNLGLDAPNLEARLERTLVEGIQRLVSRQNPDGGWGWWSAASSEGGISNDYVTAYVLFGLSRAREAGAFVDEGVLQHAVDYLYTAMPAPEMLSAGWQLDRLAFQHFALAESGSGNPAGMAGLYQVRDQLSPWGIAFLALTFEDLAPEDPRLRELYSDLEATAVRTATGAHWEGSGARVNFETPVYNTAAVVYALAQHDPAATVLPEAVRYLMAQRGADGAWGSTYESAWTLMALTTVMEGTGELAGDFGFSASLNGIGLLEGSAGGDTRLNPVHADVPITALYPEAPNALLLQRTAGPGRLYYSAHLHVQRPVEDVLPLDRGISIARTYEILEGDTRFGVGDVVLVKVALTLDQAAYYLLVEDYIPAGAEILDSSLNTSQSVDVDPGDPFKTGWGWWYFNQPLIYDQHIAWSVDYLPAGTYELSYIITLNQPGEFRVLPTRAWEFYFPERMGNGAGEVFRIEE